MIPSVLSLSILFFVILVIMALLPAIIAWKRKNENRVAIYVVTLITFFIPLGEGASINLLLWIACLGASLWNFSTPSQGPQGPQGPPGPPGIKGDKGVKGDSASVLPISKAGVIVESSESK